VGNSHNPFQRNFGIVSGLCANRSQGGVHRVHVALQALPPVHPRGADNLWSLVSFSPTRSLSAYSSHIASLLYNALCSTVTSERTLRTRLTLVPTEHAIMKIVKIFSTELDANLAKIELEATGVPSIIVGIGVAMEGGVAGVQLLVPDQSLEAALKVLGDREK
jgi:hypothetical protein